MTTGHFHNARYFVLQELQHENIVALYDVQVKYILMPFH